MSERPEQDSSAAELPSQDESEGSGIAAFLGEGTILEIRGRRYRLKRLGIPHLFSLLRIIAGGAAALGTKLTDIQFDSPEHASQSVGTLLVCGLPYGEGEAIETLARMLESEDGDDKWKALKPEQVRDPELFGMEDALTILEALMQHQDLKAFFARFAKLIQANPSARNFLKTSSTQ